MFWEDFLSRAFDLGLASVEGNDDRNRVGAGSGDDPLCGTVQYSFTAEEGFTVVIHSYYCLISIPFKFPCQNINLALIFCHCHVVAWIHVC